MGWFFFSHYTKFSEEHYQLNEHGLIHGLYIYKSKVYGDIYHSIFDNGEKLNTVCVYRSPNPPFHDFENSEKNENGILGVGVRKYSGQNYDTMTAYKSMYIPYE